MISLEKIWASIYSPIGLIIASMFAGEYVRPAAMISRFLENVRGRF
jgi:hypothetical protein